MRRMLAKCERFSNPIFLVMRMISKHALVSKQTSDTVTQYMALGSRTLVYYQTLCCVSMISECLCNECIPKFSKQWIRRRVVWAGLQLLHFESLTLKTDLIVMCDRSALLLQISWANNAQAPTSNSVTFFIIDQSVQHVRGLHHAKQEHDNIRTTGSGTKAV